MLVVARLINGKMLVLLWIPILVDIVSLKMLFVFLNY